MNLKMPDLKRCLEKSGFKNVVTVLSSGNVVFDAPAASETTLEKKIEAGMKKNLDKVFYTIVRSVEDLQEILDADHFKEFKLKSSHKTVMTFIREKPKTKVKLPIHLDEASILKVKNKEVYSAYIPGPKGPVFMTLIEKTFGKDVTTRTMGTIAKLVKK